jgi:Cu(I)/Ag(I) efflux system membrane fusion protein
MPLPDFGRDRRARLLAITAGLIVVAAAVAIGLRYGTPRVFQHAELQEQPAEVWSCPMHPDVRQGHPGRCPICGMELERQDTADDRAHGEAHGSSAVAASPARHGVEAPPKADTEARAAVTLDNRRRQAIGVRVAPVTTASLTRAVRATGTVRFDESRWTDVNVRAEGWIRQLHVDRTGVRVQKGDPLFALYSPDLATAAAEFAMAVRTRAALDADAGALSRADADRLVDAARQRLARWDLPPDQIEALSRGGQVEAAVLFRSPVSGVVMEKQAVQGMRVESGMSLYRIVDTSVLWVEADVYESDLAAVRLGQTARLQVDAYPGETFAGQVNWIAPTVDDATRTARVRIVLANRGGRLKPGMFARVELTAQLPRTLVIPTDALLDAGGGQFVFVEVADGYFEPRQVKAGHRIQDTVQILEGVEAGERVAASATFFLDSESQLRAALDGYAPPAEQAAGGAAPGGTRPLTRLDIALRSTPDPPKAGATQFEAIVRTPDGKPVTDASVTLVLYMPAMPSMNMPAMRSEAALGHAGHGAYRGTIDVMMNGRWDATVTVTRNGARLASKQLTLMVR